MCALPLLHFQASNSATHYSDVSKARLIEFLRALTGMAALDTVVGMLQQEIHRLSEISPRLAALLTRGSDGFPHIDTELEVFRYKQGMLAVAR